MSYLKETALAYQTQQDPYSSFSNSDFLQQCKLYSHCTQQELNIKDKFIVQSANPHEQSIKLIKQIPSLSTFQEISEYINQAVRLIYEEVAKVSSTLLTGDDLTDIIVYVVLKSSASGLIQTLCCYQNHMPQALLTGETGYNAMGIMMAATVICQITPEYFRQPSGKPSDTLLSSRYLVPEVQLLDYLIYDDASPAAQENHSASQTDQQDTQ